jgi:hypothetical protein
LTYPPLSFQVEYFHQAPCSFAFLLLRHNASIHITDNSSPSFSHYCIW